MSRTESQAISDVQKIFDEHMEHCYEAVRLRFETIDASTKAAGAMAAQLTAATVELIKSRNS